MPRIAVLLAIGLMTASPAIAAPATLAQGDIPGGETPMLPAQGSGADNGAGAGPAVTSASLIKELYEVCSAVAQAEPDALRKAEARGWAEDEDNEGDAPYFTQTAASKSFGGVGPVEMWGTVDFYPQIREGYCRMDLTDADNLIDFADFKQISGLDGKVTNIGGDTYAAWQIGSGTPKVMITAQRVAGDFQMEINTILPPAPPPIETEPGRMPAPTTEIPDEPSTTTAD